MGVAPDQQIWNQRFGPACCVFMQWFSRPGGAAVHWPSCGGSRAGDGEGCTGLGASPELGGAVGGGGTASGAAPEPRPPLRGESVEVAGAVVGASGVELDVTA